MRELNIKRGMCGVVGTCFASAAVLVAALLAGMFIIKSASATEYDMLSGNTASTPAYIKNNDCISVGSIAGVVNLKDNSGGHIGTVYHDTKTNAVPGKICLTNGTLPNVNSGGPIAVADGQYSLRFNNGGSTASYSLVVDTTAPTITIKTGTGVNDGSYGEKHKNGNGPYYGRISFELYDNKALKEVVLNGNVYARGGTGNDLNWQNITKSHLQLGNNTITVRDMAGNETTITFIYDDVPPTAIVKNSSVGIIGDNLFTKVDFSLKDNFCVTGVFVNGNYEDLDNSGGSDWNNVKVGKAYGVYGKNTLQVKDCAGNLSQEYVFYLDDRGPEIMVKGKNNNYTPVSQGSFANNVYRQVSFKLYDDYKVASWSVNGGCVHNPTQNKWSDANNIVVGKVCGVYGENVITVTDVLGNVSTYKFWLDNVGPTVTVTAPKNGEIMKDNCSGCATQVITGTVTDTLAGVDRVEVYLRKVKDDNGKLGGRGAKLDATVNPDGTWSVAVDVTTLADGIWGFDVETYDKAGNESKTLNWGGGGVLPGKGFIVDNTAPTISNVVIFATSHIKNEMINSQQKICVTFTASEALAGNPSVKLGGLVADVANLGSNKYLACVWFNGNNIADGEVSVLIENYQDLACNDGSAISSTSDGSSVHIDTVAPTGSVTYSPNSGWTNMDVTAYLETSEPIATPDGWTKVDDTHFTKVFTANATENVALVDATGNSGSATAGVSWIDKVAPTINPIVTVSTDGNTLTLIGGISDDLSGIAQKNCALYPGAAKVNKIRDVSCDGNIDVSDLANGTYYLHLWAKDNAGNQIGDNTLPFAVDFEIKRLVTPDPEEGGGIPDGPYTPGGGGTAQTPGGGAVVGAVASGALSYNYASAAAATAAEDAPSPTPPTQNNSAKPNNQIASTNHGEVLGASDAKDWSLVNLLLTVAVAVMSLVMIVRNFVGREDDDKRTKRHTALRFLSLIPVAGAVIAFLLVEDLSLPMGWLNQWTILLAGIAIVQVVIAAVSRRGED
ncbi:MAG: hypothetical protein LBC95_00095 [Candidatus Nomurabacteria bacterium]|jgi:hypothetical protein|nr:hypothetical protein [Candidatus Nomurabacteria bacterium]